MEEVSAPQLEEETAMEDVEEAVEVSVIPDAEDNELPELPSDTSNEEVEGGSPSEEVHEVEGEESEPHMMEATPEESSKDDSEVPIAEIARSLEAIHLEPNKVEEPKMDSSYSEVLEQTPMQPEETVAEAGGNPKIDVASLPPLPKLSIGNFD
jgi:hypothetical protein